MTNQTRKHLAAMCAACAVVAGVPAVARAWAGGAHAYIALHTDKKSGLTDANELCNRVYGANAVDLFNTSFTPIGRALQAILHGEGNATAAEAWDVATGYADATDAERAFAYGFASHNDGWGTDFIAHWSGKTLDRNEGYVVTKARQLAAVLPPEALALLGGDATRIAEVTHVLVEYSMDLLLADSEPSLGTAMIWSSSLLPYPGMSCSQPAGPRVLVDTLFPYVSDIVGADGAEATILAADGVSRYVVLALGTALSQPTPEARLDAVAGLVSTLAGGFLGEGAPPPEALKPLIAQLLAAGKAICAGDLMPEIEATIGRVNGKMSALGISQ